MKIIELSKVLKENKPGVWFKNGQRILAKMNHHDADAITDFIRKYSLYELRISLGLEKVDQELLEDDDNFKFADLVQDIYSEMAAGCYFCDKQVDPNGEPFDDNTYLCLDCYMKAKSLMKFHGINVK
jgi:hypothetical protein